MTRIRRRVAHFLPLWYRSRPSIPTGLLLRVTIVHLLRRVHVVPLEMVVICALVRVLCWELRLHTRESGLLSQNDEHVHATL